MTILALDHMTIIAQPPVPLSTVGGALDCANRRVIELLYQRLGRAVVHRVARVVGRNDLAQEILQETFMRLWTLGPSFATELAAFSWVYKTSNQANDVFIEKVHAIGLIPTSALEFNQLTLRFSELSGCSSYGREYQYAYCPGEFNFYVEIEVTAGSDILDRVGMTLPFANMTRTHVRQRLVWAIDQIVKRMVENGTLDGNSIETPYY